MSIRSQELLVSLLQECVVLVGKISEVLQKERLGLISFDIDKLTKSTMEKTTLINQLKEKRESLKRVAQVRYGKNLSEVGGELSKELIDMWTDLDSQWRVSWLKLSTQCESNQRLLKHSLKNMDLLLGNLKTLFGNPILYNQSGRRQDLSNSGKVLEGRF